MDNARRLKRAVLQASAWHRGVHCRTKKAATLVETMEAIETVTDVWDSAEAIVVLHAGLSDIQDDTSPHDSTENIKSQITSSKARAKGHFFVVYGVPEVGPKDDTMRIKCELWNQNLRQICSDIGTRVEFVSVTKALQDKMNGTSYSEYVAEQLGQRLGHRLCAFLGLRPSGNYKHRAWKGETNNLHDDCPGTGNPTNGQSTEEAEALLAQDIKKKSARRRRSRKKNEDIHVGFLNLHGESRKGGGIGFLWKTRSAWKKLDSPFVEHMWVEGYLQGLASLGRGGLLCRICWSRCWKLKNGASASGKTWQYGQTSERFSLWAISMGTSKLWMASKIPMGNYYWHWHVHSP
ncbi:hypothetical protein MRX96_044896 [Rhipicephalus microplus]